MQQLTSNYREEDVANEVSDEDLLHRRTEGLDVGPLGDLIARLCDRNHSSVEGILKETGGIRPLARRRSRLPLRASEREEISRGVVAGRSIRSIAITLGRAPSTVSREIQRNGGR